MHDFFEERILAQDFTIRSIPIDYLPTLTYVMNWNEGSTSNNKSLYELTDDQKLQSEQIAKTTIFQLRVTTTPKYTLSDADKAFMSMVMDLEQAILDN